MVSTSDNQPEKPIDGDAVVKPMESEDLMLLRSRSDGSDRKKGMVFEERAYHHARNCYI